MDTASARTALYDFGRDCYLAASTAALGAAGELRYGGGPDYSTPADDRHWARVSSRVVDEYQETLRLNTRRWVSTGTFIVQLFAPVADQRAQVRLDAISEAVRSAIRLHRGEIEFTRAVINDGVRDEPQWRRANVTAVYTYRQFM